MRDATNALDQIIAVAGNRFDSQTRITPLALNTNLAGSWLLLVCGASSKLKSKRLQSAYIGIGSSMMHVHRS